MGGKTITIGPNDRCWCGSGLKYKRCHRNRQEQSPPNPYVSAQVVRERFRAKGCLHPLASGGYCAGKIVRAHSVRRSADLDTVAREGHVYQLRGDFEILVRTGGRPEATLIGINEASTFNGFCAHHDHATFRPLELGSFRASKEQCFLLLYRAWARETYTKQASAKSIEIYRDADKGRPLPEQLAMQSFLSSYAAGIELGVADVMYYKHILDSALLARNYDAAQSLIIYFDSPPDVLCSGATYPYWDFEGRDVQPQGPRPRPVPLSLSLLATPNGSAAIFTWLRHFGGPPQIFLASLRRQERLGDAIIRFAFSALENVFARPTWWDSLPESHQKQLVDLFVGYMSPIIATQSNHLCDQGYRFTDWKVSIIADNYRVT